jgi:hypothetical protein
VLSGLLAFFSDGARIRRKAVPRRNDAAARHPAAVPVSKIPPCRTRILQPGSDRIRSLREEKAGSPRGRSRQAQVPPPPSPPLDQADITRLLQAHLKRVRCNSGNVDGKWDDSSRKALELFNKNAHTEFDVKVASLDALDAVRGKSDRVCPLVGSAPKEVLMRRPIHRAGPFQRLHATLARPCQCP